MSIFKKEKEDGKIKYLNLKPFIKKQYGWNWRKLNIMDQNTKALEDIAEQLKNINETLKTK